MPRRLSLVNRDTTDLHAAWWSDAKDAQGRYLERVTVYSRLSYADQQWVQTQLFSSGALDVSAMLQLAQSTQGQTPEAAALALAANPDKNSLAGLLNSESLSLLVRLAEITDEIGAPLPIRDASGQLLPGAEDVLGELDAQDMNFIREQVQQLDKADAVVPVLPVDAQRAAAGDPSGADGRGASGVAEATFPQGGEAGVAGSGGSEAAS